MLMDLNPSLPSTSMAVTTGLVRGARIGAERDRNVPRRTGNLRHGSRQRGRARIDQRLTVDPKLAGCRHGDFDRILALLGGRLSARLRQLELDPRLIDERRGYHEEDQEQQDDVDQRREIELGLLVVAAREVHYAAPP